MPLLKRSKRLARACMSCRTSTPPIQPGVLYLCSAYPVRDGDEPGTIGLGRIRPIVGNDWGWWRTVTLNLNRITALASGDGQRLVPAGGKHDAIEQLAVLSKLSRPLRRAFAGRPGRKWANGSAGTNYPRRPRITSRLPRPV